MNIWLQNKKLDVIDLHNALSRQSSNLRTLRLPSSPFPCLSQGSRTVPKRKRREEI